MSNPVLFLSMAFNLVLLLFLAFSPEVNNKVQANNNNSSLWELEQPYALPIGKSSEVQKCSDSIFINQHDQLESSLQAAEYTIRNLQAELMSSYAESKKYSNEIRREITDKMDRELTHEFLVRLAVSELPDRMRILKAMTQIKNKEATEAIYQLILNEDEDINMRSELIRTIDWHGSVDKAINLLNSTTNNDLKASVIFAARDSLDGYEKSIFNESLQEVFRNATDEFVQLAAIDYYADNKEEALTIFNNLDNLSFASDLVRSHWQASFPQ